MSVRTRASSLLCLLAALVVGQTSATASPILDQQSGFTPGFSYFTLGNGGFLSQTFTAGIDGELVGVTIDTIQFSGAGPFALELRNTVAGAPGSSVLASTLLGPSNAYGGPIIFFPTPGPSVAGTLYSLVLEIGSSWGMAGPGDQYASGNGYVSLDGLNWTSLSPSFASADDFAFTTYVEPVPEPATLVLLCTGLAAAGLRRMRRTS